MRYLENSLESVRHGVRYLEQMAVEGFEFWAPHIADWGMYSPLKAGSIDGTDTVPHDRAVVRAMTAVCKLKCTSL